jgi:hypothetical protein
MEEKNIFVNAEGAFKAIEDALKYLGDNGYVEGILVLGATEKSGVDIMMQGIYGAKLDVVIWMMMAAINSKNIKDVIMEASRIIAKKWEEMVIACELQEEAADE